MTKQKKIAAAVLSASLLACGIGTYWATHWNLEETNDAYVDADISPVIAKSEGYVSVIHVTDNQQVHAGDLLAEIDDHDYANRENELVAQVKSKQAALDNIASRIALQKAEVAQAQSTLLAAHAEEARAKSDAARFSDLLKQQFATRQRAEAASADAVKASAMVSADSAAVSAQAATLAGFDSLVQQARADVASAQAQLDQVRVDRSHTRIIAPVDGLASKRAVQLGQLVHNGSQMLSIVQTQSISISANFKETQISHMRPGQPVKFTVDAFPHTTFVGVVDSLSPASGAKFSLLPQDNGTGNFTKIVQRVPVKIRVTQPADWQSRLRPGLSAVVTVDTSRS